MKYSYSDKRIPGGRYPQLWLVPPNGEAPVRFSGKDIPGTAIVTTSYYEKGGKWSGTEYTLELFQGVRPLILCPPLHNEWGTDIASWEAMCNFLKLPRIHAEGVVRKAFPAVAERLDYIDQAREEADRMAEIPAVTQAGWVDCPAREKAARNDDLRVCVGHQEGAFQVLWPLEGAVILEVRHTPGYRGGVYSVKVEVNVDSPVIPPDFNTGE